jgi:hypothetical protein
MPMYVVERILPGASVEALEAIREAAQEACRALAMDGKSVRYLRSIFTPGESRCRCLFEAADGDLVREVNDAAELPYSRIVLAVEIGEPGASIGLRQYPGQGVEPYGVSPG